MNAFLFEDVNREPVLISGSERFSVSEEECLALREVPVNLRISKLKEIRGGEIRVD